MCVAALCVCACAHGCGCAALFWPCVFESVCVRWGLQYTRDSDTHIFSRCLSVMVASSLSLKRHNGIAVHYRVLQCVAVCISRCPVSLCWILYIFMLLNICCLSVSMTYIQYVGLVTFMYYVGHDEMCVCYIFICFYMCVLCRSQWHTCALYIYIYACTYM